MRSCLASLLFVLLAVFPAFAAGEISRDQLDKAISRLDRTLDRRAAIISQRQSKIDSLKQVYSESENFATLMEIGDTYTSFSNDSALAYFDLAFNAAVDDGDRIAAQLKRTALMPLAGLFEAAVIEYESIDSLEAHRADPGLYYESGRKLYSYIASAYSDFKPYKELYQAKALDRQQCLLAVLDRSSDEYLFNLGEYCLLTGSLSKAKALLGELIDRTADKGPLARANHHLSSIARRQGDRDAYKFYLACSSIADMESATLEVASLQELGTTLYDDGDINRSYRYLSTALDNAVRCAATLRMVESSKAMPIIASTYNGQADSWRNSIYVIMAIMFLLLTVLVATLFVLYREMKRMRRLEARLRIANNGKNMYIGQFLKLCSIYMDKLNKFVKLADRKISAGKADELSRMLKSGKFIEEQNADFYVVFDDAFLHIYPDFAEKVNNLLRPDCAITLKEGESLNTDLRILAIMRMGIDDSATIAQILNYSLNTIYSYRNRLRSRAVDKDNFEADVMKIAPMA